MQKWLYPKNWQTINEPIIIQFTETNKLSANKWNIFDDVHIFPKFSELILQRTMLANVAYSCFTTECKWIHQAAVFFIAWFFTDK